MIQRYAKSRFPRNFPCRSGGLARTALGLLCACLLLQAAQGTALADHGQYDTPATAFALTLGSPENGTLEASTFVDPLTPAIPDYNYYKFTVLSGSSGNVFTVNLTDPSPGDPPTDTVIIVYDSNGTTALANNDDCPSPVSLLSCLSWTSPAGQPTTDYYVRVQSYANGAGDYTITVSDTGSPPTPVADDCGDTALTTTCTPQGVGTTQNLESAGDRDYFKFTVPANVDPHVYDVTVTDPTPSTTTDTMLFVIEVQGTGTGQFEVALANNDDCSPGVLTSCLSWTAPASATPTDYYARVQHYSNGLGDYELTVTDTGVATTPADDCENSALTTTCVLTIGGGAVNGFLNPSIFTGVFTEPLPDFDYYKVSVPALAAPEVYDISVTDATSPVTDTVVLVIEVQGSGTGQFEVALASNDDCAPGDVTSCLSWTAPSSGSSKDYYIRVQPFANGSGNYTLSVTDTLAGPSAPSDDCGDTAFSTTPPPCTPQGVGTTQNLEAPGDVDYFSFSAVASTPYTITLTDPTPLTGATDTVLILYDTDGITPLASNDDCTSPVSLLSCLGWTAPASGTYYFSVRGYANGVGDYEATVSP
jgi:hypothetical protein